MKGMLLKDWYLGKKIYRSYFFILLLFAALSVWAGENPFLMVYPFMLISMMPLGLHSMDEGCKWDVYCGSLPCTKAQMVSEKYLLGLIWSGFGIVLVISAQILRMALNGGFEPERLGEILVMCLTLTFFLPAISMPFVFKFGAEKGRVAQYMIIGGVCGGTTLLSLRTQNAVSNADVSIPGVILVLTAAAIYALAWLLSIRFYEKREIR